jgi:hypothetical protein
MNNGGDRGGSSKLEAKLAVELRALLQSTPIGKQVNMKPSDRILGAFELYFPLLLRKKYPVWESETLDGFFVSNARKDGPFSLQLAGICILMSDQCVTPFFAAIRLSPDDNSMEAYNVAIGEAGEGHLGISGPKCNTYDAELLLRRIGTRLSHINWVYSIESMENN